MQEDLSLVTGILEGSRRSFRAFSKRFEEEGGAAFQHCMNARELGLSYDDFMTATAIAASKTVLAALPSRETRIDLSRHVRRLLGRRDFALIVLMRRGNEAAWRQFRERYDSYLETILVRSGYAPGEIESLRNEFVAEIRGDDDEKSPLSFWRGRSDLRHWLLCFVREIFRGGVKLSSQQESEAPQQFSTTAAGKAFIGVVEEEFASCYTEISAKRQDLIERVLRGDAMADEPEIIVNKSERHEAVMDDLWEVLVRRVSRRTQVPKSEVDDLLRETFVGETEAELARLADRGNVVR